MIMAQGKVSDCISEGEGGFYLDIKVSPDSSEELIKGIDPWRDKLVIHVKERAKDGKANRAVIQLLAEELSVSHDDVHIVKGKRSDRKRVFIAVDKDGILERLKRFQKV